MKDLYAMMGPILYHIHVAEFQKRGLPHEHIAMALRNIPRTPAEIDAFLSSELPRAAGSMRDAVKRHTTHVHDPAKSMWVARHMPIRVSEPTETRILL
jgi:hypothetical protein